MPRTPTVSLGPGRRRLLHRLEVHDRRLIIEHRLKQIHLCLQKVALCLRDQERRRQSDLESSLFVGSALLRQRRARARGVHAFGGAAHLASRPPHGFGRLELETGDPLRCLTPFDFGTGVAGLIVAVCRAG